MKKLMREMIDGAEKLVEAHGGRCRFEYGKTHNKLHIEINGKTRCATIPTSPRGTDAIHQKMADVRRLIREMSPSV